jgi:hypothetical protein
MHELRINKHKVLIHDDIDQLTINQFNKVNKYWMLSDDLGDDFADIDRTHIARLLIIAGDKAKVIKEVQNMRILINNIINEVHPDQLAFAALIHSIDGVPMTDFSEDNLKKILLLLNPTVADVKKKRQKRKYSLT